ncbi:dethiobiotin synthase [Candidatus Electronema sp. JM]|uniref:dethiobiotin synthase n=1 Tax=Candidatus Electronema sp. JM TaxID=3401571 RepID=UPI003AA7DCDC
MNPPVAVCGIDTGVGKSIVSGLLARHLLERGTSAVTLKLVQTGCAGKSEDILLHRRLMGSGWLPADEQGLTCPYCFPLPASPHLAAEQAGAAIDPAKLDHAADSLAAQFDQLIVEGAGGLLVPLTRSLLLLDYLQARNWPLLLVTTPRLGSINHTLLCLEAIKLRQMRLLGLVYNLHGSHPPEIVRDSLRVFRDALGRYGFPDKIVLMPDLQESRAVNWDVLLNAAC